MASVGRRYKFAGIHHLDSVGPPYNEPHRHDYTVEVEVAGLRIEGLVVDTARLDAVWDTVVALLASHPSHVHGRGFDLNAATGTSTSVEDLAEWFWYRFRTVTRRDVQIVVTVWEDMERFGRCGP